MTDAPVSPLLRAAAGPLCISCPAGRTDPGETRCPRCREERRAFIATEAAYRAGGMEITAPVSMDVAREALRRAQEWYEREGEAHMTAIQSTEQAIEWCRTVDVAPVKIEAYGTGWEILLTALDFDRIVGPGPVLNDRLQGDRYILTDGNSIRRAS